MRHPNKHIQAVIDEATAIGWRLIRKEIAMVHQFTAKLLEPESGGETTNFCERLYARAADATSASQGGTVLVSFDREAESLEQALRSAIADIVAAGGTVDSLEIEREEIAQWLAS